MQAVIDRFEGDYAVVLVGEEEEQQLDVPKKFLPKKAQEGDCLDISFEIDKDTTEQRKKRVSKLLDKLKNKGRVNMLHSISQEEIEEAISYLAANLDEELLRKVSGKEPEDLFHFGLGIKVRNLLREKFGWNDIVLDNLWASLTIKAARGEY